jgi:hypothetical protein
MARSWPKAERPLGAVGACRILIESAGDSPGAANQIQVVVQTEAGSDGEALFDGFARARDEACWGR